MIKSWREFILETHIFSELDLPEPFVMLLVGPPLSGKSTWIRNNFPETTVISRDEIILELYGSRDYDKAFREVDQKEVDRILDLRLKSASAKGGSVIIDMTNMVAKRRIANLNYFRKNYYKVCVIFPILSEEQYASRNKKRFAQESKDIPDYVIKRMISQYQEPTLDEGFDKIIHL